MKRLMSLILAIMLLMLCACGGQQNEETEAPAAATEAPTEAPEQIQTEPAPEAFDGYVVTVVDENGNPIAGAMVQMCSESCFPAATDAEGNAKFNLEEAEYKVSFLFLPEGYTYADGTDAFYFEEGSKEMTITLASAQ